MPKEDRELDVQDLARQAIAGLRDNLLKPMDEGLRRKIEEEIARATKELKEQQAQQVRSVVSGLAEAFRSITWDTKK